MQLRPKWNTITDVSTELLQQSVLVLTYPSYGFVISISSCSTWTVVTHIAVCPPPQGQHPPLPQGLSLRPSFIAYLETLPLCSIGNTLHHV